MRERSEGDRLLSTVGPVVDLSRVGLRVLTTRPLQGTLEVDLDSRLGQLHLRASVIGSRRLGFRRHLVQLKLLGIDETLARKLQDVAAAHGELLAAA
jgi:hypothetical protein